MFIHVDEKTGHVRKFANGRAAKRWLKEQAQRYVPTHVPADVNATLGVGRTFDKRKPSGFRKTWQVS